MTPKFKARPTTYKGIEMRSRLEAGFAMWLDKHNTEWVYEPRAFGSERGQYLPDFLLPGMSFLGGTRTFDAYVECKPVPWGTRDEFDAIADRMTIIRESEPLAVLLIATPNQESFGFLAITAVVGSPGSTFSIPGALMWAKTPDGLKLTSAPLFADQGPWHGEWWKG